MLSATKLRFFYAMVLFFVLSWVLMSSVFASSNRELAFYSISEAEQSVALAYDAVLNAERAGANVSGLLVRLNDAAGLLSEARMAFEAGNFDESVRLSHLSSGIGGQVWDEAETLRVEASDAAADRVWLFFAESVLAVAFVLFASFAGYLYFKRWYYRRLLKMRPRVGQV